MMLPNSATAETVCKWTVRIASILTLLILLWGLIQWIFPEKTRYEILSLQFNSIIAYLLISIALWLFVSKYQKTAEYLGWVVIFIALESIFERLYGFNHGINTQIHNLFFQNPDPHVRHISVVGEVGILLIGFAFLITPKKKWIGSSLIFQAILGMLVWCLGVFGIVGYVSPIATSIGGIAPPSLLTASSFVVLGIAITALAYFQCIENKIETKFWVPILVTLCGIVLTLLISVGFIAERNQSITPLNLSIVPDNALVFTFSAIGIFISLMLGYFIYLWEKGRENIIELERVKSALGKSMDQLELTLQSVGIGTWEWDISHDRFLLDNNALQILGQLNTQFQGNLNDFLQLVHIDVRKQAEEIFKSDFKNQPRFEAILKISHEDRSRHYIVFKGKIVNDQEGNAANIKGVCWDVSQTKIQQTLLEIQYLTGKILSETDSFHKSIKQILQLICNALSWDIGLFWEYDKKKKVLSCYQYWTKNDEEFKNFLLLSKKLSVESGLSFAGKVLESCKPVWMTDVTKDFHFLRASQAREEGIHGVFGFPVNDKTEIFGVIELFSKEPFTNVVTSDIITTVSAFSYELAQHIQRMQGEEARAQLAALVDSTHDAIIIKGLDDTILSWNKGAELMYGYSAEEIIGEHISKIIPAERRHESSWINEEISKGKAIDRYETMRKKKNGENIWVSLSALPIKDQEGKITGAYGVQRDITELKRNEAILRKSEETFRVFVETTNEWIWEIDINHRIVFSNPAITQYLGYEVQEIIGMDMMFLVAPEDQAHFIESFSNHIKMKQGWVGRTIKWRHKNGQYLWFESNAEPIINENGVLTGFRGADRDVSERKGLEEAQSQFIATVSHELRTPLTSIKGAMSLISAKEQQLGEQSRKLIDIALENAERLIRITNDILDAERLLSKKITMHFQELDLQTFIDKTIEDNQQLAERFNVTLRQEGQRQSDIYINGDFYRLMQVMTNLLSNAVRFSHPGGTVYLSIQDKGEMARISVRDEGEGIPEEFHPRIFERFAQADNTIARKATGTGLGLNIARQIIIQHLGMITFTSKKGEGTTFFVDIPKAK